MFLPPGDGLVCRRQEPGEKARRPFARFSGPARTPAYPAPGAWPPSTRQELERSPDHAHLPPYRGLPRRPSPEPASPASASPAPSPRPTPVTTRRPPPRPPPMRPAGPAPPAARAAAVARRSTPWPRPSASTSRTSSAALEDGQTPAEVRRGQRRQPGRPGGRHRGRHHRPHRAGRRGRRPDPGPRPTSASPTSRTTPTTSWTACTPRARRPPPGPVAAPTLLPRCPEARRRSASSLRHGATPGDDRPAELVGIVRAGR